MYLYITSGATSLVGQIIAFYNTTIRPTKQIFSASVIAKNNKLILITENGGFVGATEAAPTTRTGGINFFYVAETLENVAFNKITQLNWGAGTDAPYYMLDGSTLEVYS